MKSHRSIIFPLLVALCSGLARGAEGASTVDLSTKAAGFMVIAGTPWDTWLRANFPVKRELDERQKRALDQAAGSKWDARVVGDIFPDGEPGALLAKFSPSGKTLTKLLVLRWSKSAWTTLLDCGHKKLAYAKHPPITSTEPVDVYQVYLQRQPAGLDLMVTLGSAGDKLFGDAVSLSYDARTQGYVEPDDSDHD